MPRSDPSRPMAGARNPQRGLPGPPKGHCPFQAYGRAQKPVDHQASMQVSQGDPAGGMNQVGTNQRRNQTEKGRQSRTDQESNPCFGQGSLVSGPARRLVILHGIDHLAVVSYLIG